MPHISDIYVALAACIHGNSLWKLVISGECQ